jgi:hypothetical protein
VRAGFGTEKPLLRCFPGPCYVYPHLALANPTWPIFHASHTTSVAEARSPIAEGSVPPLAHIVSSR